MSEADKDQSKDKSAITDAKSKIDPQTEKQLTTNPEKNRTKPLKANERHKDKKRTLLLLLTLTLLSALLSGCGHTYTQEEMVGVYKSDGSPTFTLQLNVNGTSLTDYGQGVRFSGKWECIGHDGISTIYDDPHFNVNPTFYTIQSKDKLKPLLSGEAIKMGISSPMFNRVR